LGFDKYKYNKVIIKKDVLDNISDFAKNLAPKEFIALLSGEIKNNELYITQLVYKKFNSSYVSAGFDPEWMPDYGYIGTVHSHPRKSKPSRRDLHTFNKQQGIHLIISKPYTINDIICYNSYGEPINFEIQ
jgi:proteasome lid subunit RPN8/RPN11